MKKLTIKDIQNLLDVTKGYAEKIHKDIKDTYNAPMVTECHLKHYLKIPETS